MNNHQVFPLHRYVGAFIALGGVWHMVAPWVGHYTESTPLVVSNVVAGLGFIVFGGIRAISREMTWPIWPCGILGIWTVISPGVLGETENRMAVLEGIWSGLFTIFLVLAMAVDLRFGITARPKRFERRPG